LAGFFYGIQVDALPGWLHRRQRSRFASQKSVSIYFSGWSIELKQAGKKLVA